MLFKAMRAAAVIGAIYWASPERISLPDLPPASLGMPVRLGLPVATQSSLPDLTNLSPTLLPALIARVQGAAAGSAVPDLGPFSPGGGGFDTPAFAAKPAPSTWAQAPEEVRRRIASAVAHRGARMLASRQD
ncbi:hypothetical protein BHAOGJBA_4498 [Methylobacterium hispanicum]|uniref:Uncharacterized protein n=1 Tax=Methylobacterium hispanicum TaxID=270350 RepID=A0AAV4ZS26_9HYPH|nr:hypothetical protein [Methylobacterium hispanicum]GJD90954.1 hypothetical protein BHAOGJBA_4498 [Methylobacterium hispanicum]